MNINYSFWIQDVIKFAKQASSAILDIYQENSYKIQAKPDNSPLTEADLLSNQIIEQGLRSLKPSLPIISEEGVAVSFAERSKWNRFWIIDPLDGTREFINRTGEFTINIALVENHQPVLAVIAVPALQQFYWALRGGPAYFQDGSGHQSIIKSQSTIRYPIRVIISRRHHSLENKWQALLKQLNNYDLQYCGSSLKVCLIAKGEVDLYPRYGNTGEWDTAAPQCILEAAGGMLVDLNGNPLQYNKNETLINPSFCAISCSELLPYVLG